MLLDSLHFILNVKQPTMLTEWQLSLILLLFQSFEVASACFLIFFQNISPCSRQIKPKVADTFSATAEGNAQRNKLSLHAQKSSGITHFRKAHLKRCEVVMKCIVHSALQAATILVAIIKITLFESVSFFFCAFHIHVWL